MKLVVFTDLDGTLLDADTYSCEPAWGALSLLERLGVPVVICSSKTAAEIAVWRRGLGNLHPFVSENGGGIFIPAGYFSRAIPGAKPSGDYSVIGLGAPYARLREAIAKLRAEGFDIKGFGDMTAGEVAELTGLGVEEAALARAREYDEPFVYGGGKESLTRLLEAIVRMGLKYTSGRLMHILGESDKGLAVRRLAEIYRGEHGDVITSAIGDSLNDAPMLAEADYPFLVRKPGGFHDPEIADSRVIKVEGIGPHGWSEAMEGLVRRLGLL